MSIIKNMLMEKLTIEEKIEINAALHGRVKFMKETLQKSCCMSLYDKRRK